MAQFLAKKLKHTGFAEKGRVSSISHSEQLTKTPGPRLDRNRAISLDQ